MALMGCLHLSVAPSFLLGEFEFDGHGFSSSGPLRGALLHRWCGGRAWATRLVPQRTVGTCASLARRFRGALSSVTPPLVSSPHDARHASAEEFRQALRAAGCHNAPPGTWKSLPGPIDPGY